MDVTQQQENADRRDDLTPSAHSGASHQTISRKSFLRLGSAGVLGLTLPGVVPGWLPQAAGAGAEQVTVDLTKSIGEPDYSATGFLHGLNQDGTRPPDEFVVPLKPQLFRGGGSTLPGGGWSVGGMDGYRVRWRNVVDRFRRAALLGAEYCIVTSDLWGANGVDIKPTDPYPGDNGDWSNYERFVTQVIADVHAAGMRPDQVQLEIWNEPDYGAVYWPRPKSQYEEMWRRGVRLIRQLEPQARIEGPTFTRITVTETSWHMDEWLDMVVASDTAPNILSWHDLIPGRDPVVQAKLARDLLAARGLAGVQLEINEYPASNGLDAGYNSWYVARMERAEIDYGVLAIYGACCMYPELDGLLLSKGDQLVRTARWWVYQRYASITGQLVQSTPSNTIDSVAGLDRAARQARILLGNKLGDGTDLGTVTVTVSGMAANDKALRQRGRIPARLERIPDQPELAEPEVIKDLELKVKGDTLTMDIDWTNANDAYVITLGKQDSRVPNIAIAGVSPSPALMLPQEPTAITVLLRNFTNSPITVRPGFAVSGGYTVSGPDRVSVPANGDAQMTITVTRTGTAAGELTVTVLRQSETVTLTPSDNWVRIANLTASSTHPPSSVNNLNDGDTNSEHWGGGGAGGWNDDTANVFPDTVTATWDHAVTLSRVRIFTLDSPGLPAASWGVRDLDVRLHVDGSWRTVAQIRGNTVGMMEVTFASMQTTQLELVILDTNDHAYSRLLEIEVYGS